MSFRSGDLQIVESDELPAATAATPIMVAALVMPLAFAAGTVAEGDGPHATSSESFAAASEKSVPALASASARSRLRQAAFQ